MVCALSWHVWFRALVSYSAAVTEPLSDSSNAALDAEKNDGIVEGRMSQSPFRKGLHALIYIFLVSRHAACPFP